MVRGLVFKLYLPAVGVNFASCKAYRLALPLSAATPLLSRQ
jgi:hypothetical protein